MLRLHGLHQLVDFPTHLHSDGNLGSLLDVLLKGINAKSEILKRKRKVEGKGRGKERKRKRKKEEGKGRKGNWK